MLTFKRLDGLREKNRELLEKLKHQSRKLQKLQRPDLASSDTENESAESPGCVSGEESASDEDASKQQPSETVPYDCLLHDRGNLCLSRLEQLQPKSGLVSQSEDGGCQSSRDVGHVSFTTPGREPKMESEGQCMQPLLGYDWIAGLLDAENSLTERSEQFFSELQSFRQVHKDECVHGQLSELPFAEEPFSCPGEDEEQKPIPDTHQCTFCYRINSRLFAVPLDPQATCPVCKMAKDKQPHTEKEPAFIRVSIPRSTLLPAYRYKAHRRSSFDPADSLGLPSHCLSGWSNVIPKSDFQISSLDLRSSVKIPSDPTQNPPMRS